MVTVAEAVEPSTAAAVAVIVCWPSGTLVKFKVPWYGEVVTVTLCEPSANTTCGTGFDVVAVT
jgi:hypothetical protein